MHPKLRELNDIDPHLSQDGSSNVIRDAAGFVNIRLQSGNPDTVGVNGTSVENVLLLLLQKMWAWEKGPYANPYSALAMEAIYQAIVQLDNRGLVRWGGDDKSFPGIKTKFGRMMRALLKSRHGKTKAPGERKHISWDFDGVWHMYTSGFTSADEVLDGPIPDVFLAAAGLIDEGYDHHILSSRSNQFGGIPAMRAFLEEHWHACTGRMWVADEPHFHFPLWKVYKAPVHVDDRVLCYTGPRPHDEGPGPIQDNAELIRVAIRGFKPWRRRRFDESQRPFDMTPVPSSEDEV